MRVAVVAVSEACDCTGDCFCFEIEAMDVQDQKTQVTAFIKKVSEVGCLITLCSFTQDSDLVKLLDHMKVNYIKIDGSLVCNILRDEEDFREVIAINKLAHERGIKTIAELVETDDIVAKLNEIGEYRMGAWSMKS